MNEKMLAEIRQAVADYMRSVGCGCCKNEEVNEKAEERLAKLLNVPMYNDGSGWDFYSFRTQENKK